MNSFKNWNIILLLLCAETVLAQPIGINTKTPLASFDVRGNYRIGGVDKFMGFDSASGKISWSNSRLFVPTDQALIRHSSQSEGLYYSNTALEYRKQSGTAVFSTNWNTETGYLLGPVGIGTPTPSAKLHIQSGSTGFSTSIVSNIIQEFDGDNFLEFNTPSNYQSAILFEKPAHLQSGGIYYNGPSMPDGLIFRTNNAARMFIDNNGWVGVGGIPKSKLYVFDNSSGYVGGYFPGITSEGTGSRFMDLVTPPWAENGLLFGNPSDLASGGIVYNNVSTPNGMQFRTNGNITRMVLASNQYVGLGVTNPYYPLEVNGRMRIRSGGNAFSSAGLWLTNSGNGDAAFLGMEDDTHIGFYGSVAGWRFTMNTNSGALKVNGSEGVAGQVLMSNGNASAQWANPANQTYNSTAIKVMSSDFVLNTRTQNTPIPDLAHTFTVPGNAKVLVTLTMSYQALPSSNPGWRVIFLDFQLDNNHVTRFYESLENQFVKRIFTVSYLIPVTAGTHTIRSFISLTDEIHIFGTGSFPSNMTFKVIPE